MQPVEHAIVACAGLGSRIGLDIPKCLIPVGRRLLIDYILDLLEEIPFIRIVVGFKAGAVMDYVSKRRPDAIFVVNHQFSTSTNSYSVHLASRHLRSSYLMIDGDLLIEQRSFRRFLEEIKPCESLVGVARAKTEDAVYVSVREGQVHSFFRSPQSNLEWSGVAYMSGVEMPNNSRYVYEVLEQYLPIRAHILDCYEIDTPQDLDLALRFFDFEGNRARFSGSESG